jgi:predicted unusual protein kinase regulating ubiquinone biosynthesis (AarF/ABC1/UbiB family)
MGELPPEFQSLIKDLFYTFMIDQDFARVARAYKDLGILDDSLGSDEELGLRLQMVIAPMLGSVGGLSLADFITSALEMAKQYGMQAPKEMVLVAKQLLYMERYTKGLAPDWQIATDLYLVKNIFPEAVAAKAAELGITFPD